MKDKIAKLQALISGVISGAPMFRQDAAYDTAFLARELTQIEAEAYRVEYEDIVWRRFIPVKNQGLNPGATTFVFKIWDYFGLAKFISNFADDLPSVSLRATEQASPVRSIGDSYQFSAVDLMHASMAGVPLEREESRAAFEFVERKIEQVALRGASEVGLYGFANHPDVTIAAPAANGGENGGGGTSTQFRHKTSTEILADLYGFSQTMRDRAKQKEMFTPNTMLMPPTLYGLIATKPVSDLQPQITVLQTFLATDPWIKTVEPWSLLETMGADSGPRIVVYRKDPKLGEFYEPMPAKAEQPQNRNLAVVVNVWARIGGWVLRQPLGYMYVDSAGFVP